MKKYIPYHMSRYKIYREEAVGLKSSNYTSKQNKTKQKNTLFLWIREIWGNFMKIWYFINNYFIKVQI